jgi:hypothetical protein
MSVGQEVVHELPDLVRAPKGGEVTRPWERTELAARQRAGKRAAARRKGIEVVVARDDEDGHPRVLKAPRLMRRFALLRPS